MMKRCFVISPIGEAGSAIREHADDVFDFIIKPAMDELGIHVYRSDHNQQVGRITDQMYHSILEDDFCIAILTFYNPNVFYELAIAQCAARPVIILIEKGHTIPFDVRDLRSVEYDLRPRALRDGVYTKQIVDIVRNLEAADWRVEVPFGKDLTPLGNKQCQLKHYDKVESYGTSERWLSLLMGAGQTVDLSGISLRWWTRIPAFRTTFVKKAEQECKIRFLLMHPDNPALPQCMDFAGRRIGGLEHVVAEIRGTYAVFAQMAAAQPTIEVRLLRHGCLTHLLTKVDDTMLISFLLYSQGTAQSPLLECTREAPFFQTLEGEFNTLWELNDGKDRSRFIVPSSDQPAPAVPPPSGSGPVLESGEATH